MQFADSRWLAKMVAAGACATVLSAAATAQDAPTADPATLKAQWERYTADAVANPVELAPMRVTEQATAADGATLRLVSLHPGVNRWHLVERVAPEGRAQSWHLENADAATWTLSLTKGDDPALLISGRGEASQCRPWAGETSELATAAGSGLPYAPVCGGKLFLRNKVAGSRTNREAVSDFLRKNVVFGDKLVNLIKGAFFEDAFLETAALGDGSGDNGDVVAALGQARLDRRPNMRTAMGLPVTGAPDGMEAGSWYAVEGQEGIFASVMQPGLIAQEILAERNGANWLDGVERNADVYLAAFDLGRFEIGYELGTDHPGLEWSSRPSRRGAEWNMAGPDGFSRADPLVRNGMLNPALLPRVAGAIAGGFKRDHGAFRFGDYAGFNRGHHYGFISNGVTFSRLIENLSTLYITTDGEIGMKLWQEADNEMIPRLAFARQNGVPLVQRDPETGASVPGDRVTSWGGGNWSGSAEAQLRTLRAGACLREAGGRQFLIYAYFSSVTPSAMARTFQAYDCDHAMLLDMNSPELTYMAVYRQNAAGDGLEADHLSRLMAESDPWAGGVRVPRFVTFSDNRDFIYLLRKE
ncbi:hypothetical protein [Sinisalibacter lacisalsi]|uniref:Uncharacterized protein n=1 Tax=Sinisalibacter lacisalsi TaxID=1526570 RepID=A0ABQ1QVN0_9RHOB|nr:hypothetical protein [Sinisalibacter lacisalsi]GGD46249.1 hypothetical protein GCM10011358_32410 [Sinisalibacter lacisalsi]